MRAKWGALVIALAGAWAHAQSGAPTTPVGVSIVQLPQPAPSVSPLPPLAIQPVYQELKLKTADQSPDIRMARANAWAKGAQVYTAFARWLPQASATLSQTTSKDYTFLQGNSVSFGAFSGLSVSEVTNARWSIGFAFPIFRRQIQLNLEQSAYESDLAHAQLRLRLAELDWRLRKAVGDALLQLYKIANLNHSIEIAKTNVRDAKVRFELGQNTRVDVLRAEANLASLDARRFLYEQERVSAISALITYTGSTGPGLDATGLTLQGRTDAELARVIEEFADYSDWIETLKPYLSEDTTAVGHLLDEKIPESSDNYKSLLAEESIASAQAAAVMSADWPELNATASIYNQRSSWSDVFTPTNMSYQYALTLTVPLFSFGTTASTFIQKINAQKSARLKREKDVLGLRNDIEGDILRTRALLRTLESYKIAVAQNEEIARLSQTSYRLGKSTLLELLQSDSDLTASKLNLAQSRIDLSVSARKLAWNLGVYSP